MPSSILYSSARSPHCFKVSMVLEEKRIAFERIEIDLVAEEQKMPAYLAINPLGQVPVYEDDQGVHIDSLVILQYLDERYPDPSLFPSDPTLKQEVLDWIDCSSGPMRDVSHHLYWQLIEPPQEGTDWTEVGRLKVQGYALLDTMEASLAHAGNWLCGDLSAADFSVFAWIYGYKRFDLPEAWARYPNIQMWYQRLENRPCVQSSYQKTGKPFEMPGPAQGLEREKSA